ncbi:uncharacterized protein [Henckelia pumila]|uniref:uncharacterized protein n=1 Tax=Henckelia pumila TaxID=405737 RepID=UPI003C6DF2CC
MGDHSRTNSHDLFHILGFGSICKACRSLVTKCYPEKRSSFPKKIDSNSKPKSIQKDCKSRKDRASDKGNKNEMKEQRHNSNGSTRGLFRHKSFNSCHVSQSGQSSPPTTKTTGPSPLKRTTSYNYSSLTRSNSRNQTTMSPARASLSRTMSRRNSLEKQVSPLPRMLSKTMSRKGSTLIMYSNSSGLVKPPAMEQELECTLEEICFGCIKKVNITIDTVTENGQVIEEDKVLTIKVKPGWKKGTTITFEGMGNEIQGMYPADVIFVVAEKQHPTFHREGDDLQLEVEIPLVEALTGCTLAVPLLEGRVMSMDIDDIIYPGHKKIIEGQGMPRQNDPKTRGNLIITFSVEFPKELTEEQRSNIVDILQNTR